MVRPRTPEFVSPPEPEEAITALRRIMRAWELDRFDATAMVGVAGTDLSAIDWAEDRLLRVAYLIELERALVALNPKVGVTRWIAVRPPGHSLAAIHRYRC